jgi:hypothetical protein
LFDIKKRQTAEHGPDGEILEFTKAANSVVLPDPRIVLFREERGLPPRRKRSRLVYDPVTKDWLPRWGKGSIKQVQDKLNFAMEEKPIHRITGMDPFTLAKAEKNAKMEKQNLATLKNKITAVGANRMKNEVKILESK